MTESFCSVGLQADIVITSRCPPEGGRYTNSPSLRRSGGSDCRTPLVTK
jgi:hypothetical protein